MAATDYMTTAEFRCKFPEFEFIGDPQVNANLDSTRNRVDPSVMGSKTNEAHGLLTAHMLAASPAGQQARLSSERGETTYLMNFKKVVRMTVIGLTVAGGPGPVQCP